MYCSCIGYLVVFHENYKYYAVKVELELKLRSQSETGVQWGGDTGVIHLFQGGTHRASSSMLVCLNLC